ncbi:MAG: hypothetical protein QXD59_02045 [Candidatus Caldarchaeum sp.]
MIAVLALVFVLLFPSSGFGFLLMWDDNSTDETGFFVERSFGSRRFVEIATLPANTTQYNDTTASVGHLYCYRVRAYRDNSSTWRVYSFYSNVACIITTAPGTSLCCPPAQLLQ